MRKEGRAISAAGNLPILVDARPRGPNVIVAVFCRYGTTVADIAAAAPVVAETCCALDVWLERDSPRRERVLLVVVRPRWGWPGR